MTDSPRLSRLDFHDPRRLPELIWKALTSWQTEALTLAQEYWTSILAHPVSLSRVSSEPMFCGAALQAIPDPGLGVEIRIGRTPVTTLLGLSRRQVLGLVSDMLDMAGDEWPEDRELTSVEMSMVELALQRLADGIGRCLARSAADLGETGANHRSSPADASVQSRRNARRHPPEHRVTLRNRRMRLAAAPAGIRRADRRRRGPSPRMSPIVPPTPT